MQQNEAKWKFAFLNREARKIGLQIYYDRNSDDRRYIRFKGSKAHDPMFKYLCIGVDPDCRVYIAKHRIPAISFTIFDD